MLEWHDCKTDPPKEAKEYLLCYLLDNEKYCDYVSYFPFDNLWEKVEHCGLFSDFSPMKPYKWAEVELPE